MHVVFMKTEVNCNEDAYTIKEDRLWFYSYFFDSGEAYVLFKLKHGNTDASRVMIEDAYDLSNASLSEILRNNHHGVRTRDTMWETIKTHLPGICADEL